MLETGSVQRMHVSPAMEEWWAEEIRRSRLPRSPPPDRKDSKSKTGTAGSSVTDRGDSKRDNQQWGGTLPGHGGT
jgi:hypothetical protein